ncbi:taste receptor type 2 member 10 [Lepus europaeus]|uniref:taste receptor type 2 member 10 n=1 Tax=Lepus europaeus TaxID=9983 RepID=UPI002B46F905|nr:taste receptor type 2 member 10 [Lepus europaeus]
MPGIMEGILFSVVIGESILGFLGNGFIGIINCIECVKNKKLSMIGFILIGLAISRICMILVLITDGIIQIFSPDLYLTSNLFEYIAYSWVIISQTNTWFATSLIILYFLKIANFSHYIFLWLKMRINWIFSLLMGSLLISLLFSFPQIVKIINNHKINNRNTTCQVTIEKNEFIIKQVLLHFGIIILFLTTLIMCFLVVISLWKHKKKMQLNVFGLRDPNTEAHVKAMKVLISFIILFILHFIGIAIEITFFTVPENKVLLILGLATAVIYPWGHSFILILANSKLKQASLRVLHQLKFCEK